MKKLFVFALFLIAFNAYSQSVPKSDFEFFPIQHASFVIQSIETTIFVDPVGSTDKYSKFGSPDIILITHIHGDHLSAELIGKVKNDSTRIIGPKTVIDILNFGELMNNGDVLSIKDIKIKALPMYNITPERQNFHKKGEGNSYILTLNGKRIFISGDTENIPEICSLKDIDHAFICMNLPYTMTVKQAATAVLEMKPKYVYPYHYRGKGGFSDIQKFKELVSINTDIKVYFLNWYSE